MVDTVTGAHTEVALTVALSPQECWTVITDISRSAEASPECCEARWLDPVTDGPHPGARFAARNQPTDAPPNSVTCVVTAAEPPHRFSWAVLDPSEEPDQAGSLWHYELLAAGPDHTRIRHRFEHGPGVTGARIGAQQDPQSLNRRLEQLRHNMLTTLANMFPTATTHKETER